MSPQIETANASTPLPEDPVGDRGRHAEVVTAVPSADVAMVHAAGFIPVVATSTADAIAAIERQQACVALISWDEEEFDGKHICEAARRRRGVCILVTTAAPARAPEALRAGCHGILLKPLTPNLLAARFGRLSRELRAQRIAPNLVHKLGLFGTNQTVSSITCPACAQRGATSFDHATYRRSWYACLGCDFVWCGPRDEHGR